SSRWTRRPGLPPRFLGHWTTRTARESSTATSSPRTFSSLKTVTRSSRTSAYMSPEQAMGDRDLDARTDVYALGTVLYEMLAGEPPFNGPTAQAIIAKRFSGEVPKVRAVRPSVPENVAQATTRALAPVA